MTQAELEARHPCLKNAPTEGAYTRNDSIQLNHKPFNEVIRNVKCLRCGEWGHKAGERDCALKDYNPHDWARQKQEDPLNYMSNTVLLEKQKLILKHGIGGLRSVDGSVDVNQQLLPSSDEEGTSLFVAGVL